MSVRVVIDGAWRTPSQGCKDARHFITQAPDRVRVIAGGFPQDQKAFAFETNSVVLTENDEKNTRYKYTRTSENTISQQMTDGSTIELTRCLPN